MSYLYIIIIILKYLTKLFSTAKSIFSIAKDLLFNTQYKYLLTSKLSQDHLKIFFSKIQQDWK